MIEVDNISKIYGSTLALQNVSFQVAPGEILGFLGPNGAGKTTTMRILTGYLTASQGTARIAGYDIHEDSMAVRQLIGYLPESPPLYPEMTVEGFLDFVARIKQVPAGDRVEKVRVAIRRCGLSEKSNVLIRKLSKGFRQRVGIAQALVHDPPVIILDEPTVGLDPRQIIEVRNLIKSLAGQHTLILSTHILPEVSMTCTQVAIINRGQVVTTGSLEDLMEGFSSHSGYDLEVTGDINRIETDLMVALQKIPGVTSLEKLEVITPDGEEPRYRLRVLCQGEAEPGKEIATTVVQNGVGLQEIRRTRTSLEEIFLQATTSNLVTKEEVDNSWSDNLEPSDPETQNTDPSILNPTANPYSPEARQPETPPKVSLSSSKPLLHQFTEWLAQKKKPKNTEPAQVKTSQGDLNPLSESADSETTEVKTSQDDLNPLLESAESEATEVQASSDNLTPISESSESEPTEVKTSPDDLDSISESPEDQSTENHN